MRRHERKSLVLLEWDRWLQAQPIDPAKATARDTLKFFCELQDRRSPLLDFRSTGRDKWQIIHGWLLREGRIAEVDSVASTAPAARTGRRGEGQRLGRPGHRALNIRHMPNGENS